jgi:hypothetical protein
MIAGLSSVAAFAEEHGSVEAFAAGYETSTDLDACKGTITTKLSESRKSVHVYFSSNECSRVIAGDGYTVESAGKLNTDSRPYYGEYLVKGNPANFVKEAYITLKSKSGKTSDSIRIYWVR